MMPVDISQQTSLERYQPLSNFEISSERDEVIEIGKC